MLQEKIAKHLEKIYSDKATLEKAILLFEELLKKYDVENFSKRNKLDHKSVYLITYGDSFVNENEAPLQVLDTVISKYLNESFTDVHILPMFPYTSDDGFSVTDFLTINPLLGEWSDIERLANSKRLMFDFVANHMSSESKWFKNFLNEKEGFEKAFVSYDVDFDSSKVVRPRTSPLFHEYSNADGNIKKVWTTFSDDQVDVNVKDPEMLKKLTAVLLEYAERGASSIRLDAIGFLWKESGTTSIHLPQTHEIVKLWHTLLTHFAPNTQIITETNVPHEENISYFGNGYDEADQVYQFPLPPLVLYTFINGKSDKLREWATSVSLNSKNTTFFNFLASHDGIGMRPIEGILSEEQKETIVNRVKNNSGKVSYKNNADGTQSVYELNINYGDALRDLKDTDDIAARKVIAAHHILLSMIGVPAIYYHSIFGSRGDLKGAEDSGINRRINREKIIFEQLGDELAREGYQSRVYEGITKLLMIRQQQPSFSPYGEQEVVNLGDNIFAVKRFVEGSSQAVISLTNVTANPQTIEHIKGINILNRQKINGVLELEPFGIAWIEMEG